MFVFFPDFERDRRVNPPPSGTWEAWHGPCSWKRNGSHDYRDHYNLC